jgi:predicted nucleic acid-binding protein
MPEVVCNTTPLQYLHQAGVLRILPALYGKILIPNAVADEISAGLKSGVNLPDPTMLDWIDVRMVPLSTWPVPRDIHRGEAEVIALAGSIHDSIMILDDLAARRHANLLGLKFTGTLGVILRARNAGLLEAVLPVVESLELAGFRLAESTKKDFLKLAGES